MNLEGRIMTGVPDNVDNTLIGEGGRPLWRHHCQGQEQMLSASGGQFCLVSMLIICARRACPRPSPDSCCV